MVSQGKKAPPPDSLLPQPESMPLSEKVAIGLGLAILGFVVYVLALGFGSGPVLGVVFFLVLLVISEREANLTIFPTKPSLTLSFRDQRAPDQESFRLDWPIDKPLLWATIKLISPAFVPSPRTLDIPALAAGLLLANMAPGSKVYFAIGTDSDNEYLKAWLQSYKEFFEEWTDTWDPALFSGGFRSGKKGPSEVRILLGSTGSREILETIFKLYTLESQFWLQFPFVVALEEPVGWKGDLASFFPPGKKAHVSADLIDSSQLFIVTLSGQGLEIVSSKLSRMEIEQFARSTATIQKTRLEVRDYVSSCKGAPGHTLQPSTFDDS